LSNWIVATGEMTDEMLFADQAARSHWLNAERIRVYSWIVLVIFLTTLAVWIALSLPRLVDLRGKPIGYDFIAFWSAARLAVEGNAAGAYDWATIQAAHRLAVPALGGNVFLWHYPPTYLLMVLPLGLLPYLVALVLFLAVTGALWAVLIRRLFADRRVWIVAAAMPAGLVNLVHGQNGFLTAALGGLALITLDSSPVLAGVLIGLLAVKPHLAVLFPIALAASHRWRAFASAAVTSVVFSAVSVAVFGWSTVDAFLHDLPLIRTLVDSGFLPWGMMPSPYVFALSLGSTAPIAMALQIATAAAAALCVWFAWRDREAPFEAKAAVLVIASLLVSPYIFYYDLTWAGLGIGWLAMLGLRCGFRPGERDILFVAWLTPWLMLMCQRVFHVQIGFPMLIALLALGMTRAYGVGARVKLQAMGRRSPVLGFGPGASDAR
jgi:hypothetical protein